MPKGGPHAGKPELPNELDPAAFFKPFPRGPFESLAGSRFFTTVMGVTDTPTAIVFFDGCCNLCNGFVRFIMDRDPAGHFQFASLQSPYAAQFFAAQGWSGAGVDSVVLFAAGRFWVMSDAALEIASRLPRPWSWGRFFRILPRGFRDWIYRGVARHRYRVFGRREACRLPAPGEASRFLG